jgi:ATP-dependent Clp protease ATP-binding subunit ClpX
MSRTSAERPPRKKAVKAVSETPSRVFEEMRKLYDLLSSKIVGQDEAKRVISMAVALHLDRISGGESVKKIKSNVLLHGPTGSGKTEIARTIASTLNIPFIVIDSTKITPSGYTGEDATAFLHELIDKAGGDIAKAQHGIVFIDEIDKLASQGGGNEGSYHSRKVQSELLKVIEGTKVQLKKRGAIPGFEQNISIDTSDILFIGAGAFEGLEELCSESERTIGINSLTLAGGGPTSQSNLIKAFCAFGLIPELAGRFQLIAKTHRLTKGDYVKMLSDKGFSHTSNYYANLLGAERVELIYTPSLIEDLAQKAIHLQLGARGIQGLIESRMVELVFEIESLKGKRILLEADGYTVEGDDSKKSTSLITKFLSENSVLSVLEPQTLARFCSLGKIVTYEASDILMSEGEDPNSVMILLSGSLRATNKSGLNVARSEAGSCFGEISFLDGKKRSATLKAETAVKVLTFTAADLTHLIEQMPDVGVKVLRAFSRVACERVRT